jgi:hypothetical protein
MAFAMRSHSSQRLLYGTRTAWPEFPYRGFAMDRRQFTDAIKFFSRARHVYEDLGDCVVAEECAFAIALAQRVMGDAERRAGPHGELAKPAYDSRPHSSDASTTIA